MNLVLPQADLLMGVFDGGALETRTMSRVGCLDYSATPWEAVRPGVLERHVSYKFNRYMSIFGGEVASTQLKFPAEVQVENHGPMDGKHSVLMFLRWPNATNGRPSSQLIGFRSQHLKAGEKANVRIDVSPCEHFSRAREDGKMVIDRGSHFLMVGRDEWEISFEA